MVIDRLYNGPRYIINICKSTVINVDIYIQCCISTHVYTSIHHGARAIYD